MSTITVVKKNGVIAIAAESLTSFGSTKMHGEFAANSEKIVRWGDHYIGMVGSVAMHRVFDDLVASSKKVPAFDSQQSVFKYFNKLHNKLKKKYHLNPEEDSEDPVESSQYEIVICNKHGIFGVHSLREVYEWKKYWAYGSGGDYALGAMHAMYDIKGRNAESIAIAGVEAGIQFDNASDGEIKWHIIEL